MAKKKEFSQKVLEELKRRGIPFKIVSIDIDPKIERQVNEYVKTIEEAHGRAGKSRLNFRELKEVPQVGTSHYFKSCREAV